MSEFEYEDYVDPAEALASAEDSSPSSHPVTEMYFNEDGSPKEFPDGDVALGAYLAQVEQQAEGEEGQLNPALDYERPPESDGEYDFATRAQAEAQAQASARAYQEQLVEEVRRAGSKDGIRSEEAVGRAAAVVEQWRQAVFADFLAGGASLQQAFQGLNDLDNSPAIEAALAREQRLAFTRGTGLEQWRMGQEADAARRAREGLPPRPSVFASPSLQRMARASEARLERAEQRKQDQREAYARAQGRWW